MLAKGVAPSQKKPGTVINWHRTGFKLHWKRISRKHFRAGRKPTSREVRDLIFRMVAEKRTWGAPRIDGELTMPSFEISERTVPGWMRKCPRDPSRRNGGQPCIGSKLFMAEREGFSSASYRKSRDSNDLENNSFIFFLLSEVSIFFPVSLVLSSAFKKQTPNRHQIVSKPIRIRVSLGLKLRNQDPGESGH